MHTCVCIYVYIYVLYYIFHVFYTYMYIHVAYTICMLYMHRCSVRIPRVDHPNLGDPGSSCLSHGRNLLSCALSPPSLLRNPQKKWQASFAEFYRVSFRRSFTMKYMKNDAKTVEACLISGTHLVPNKRPACTVTRWTSLHLLSVNSIGGSFLGSPHSIRR